MSLEEKLSLRQLESGDHVKIDGLSGTSLYVGVVDCGSPCSPTNGYYFLDLIEQEKIDAGWSAGGRYIPKTSPDLNKTKYTKVEWTRFLLDQAVERVKSEMSRYPLKIYPQTHKVYQQILERLSQIILS